MRSIPYFFFDTSFSACSVAVMLIYLEKSVVHFILILLFPLLFFCFLSFCFGFFRLILTLIFSLLCVFVYYVSTCTCVFVCMFHDSLCFQWFGFFSFKREFGVVLVDVCPHTGPATLSSSTWLYSSFLIMILWFTGVSFSIHGFLIADRSPEVRCSPLRFVMLSRQN